MPLFAEHPSIQSSEAPDLLDIRIAGFELVVGPTYKLTAEKAVTLSGLEGNHVVIDQCQKRSAGGQYHGLHINSTR